MCTQVDLSEHAKACTDGKHTEKPMDGKYSRCTVNRTLLPLKMFYFFFYGACGAVIPFISVFMKSLHLTAAETGVVTGASVFAAAFLRTGIGVLADKMGARKAFLMISCFGFGAAFFFLWFIPPRTDLILPVDNVLHNTSDLRDTQSLPGVNQVPQIWACFYNGSELCRYPASTGHTPCKLIANTGAFSSHRISKRAVYHTRSSSDGHANDASSIPGSLLNLRDKRSDAIHEQSSNLPPHVVHDNPYYLSQQKNYRNLCFFLEDKTQHPAYSPGDTVNPGETLQVEDTRKIGSSRSQAEDKKSPIQTHRMKCLPDCTPIFSGESASSTSKQVSVESLMHILAPSVNLSENDRITATDKPVVFTKIQGPKAERNVFRADVAFLVSLILVTTARAFYSSATSLADAVTYSILGPRSLKWGRQRMWGTVGTALAVLSATNINDHLKGDSFAALFFTCLGLSSLATLMGGIFLRADKSPKQSSLHRDVAKLLSEASVKIFLLKLIIYGIMCGTAQNFFFWFLVDLGSNQTTLGLCVAVHCLSSVFALRFSSRIFKHLSHDTVIRLVLVTYVVRFLVFSFLTHAWSALPIEMLHGITYSLMWAAASSTASQIAPPGTHASCQAIAGAAYWDLGRGLGNLLTGQLMQVMGARWVFRSYAGTCCLLLPVFWLLDRTWPILRQEHILPVSTCDEDFKQNSSEVKGAEDFIVNQKLLEYEKASPHDHTGDTNCDAEDDIEQNGSTISDLGGVHRQSKNGVLDSITSSDAVSTGSHDYENSTKTSTLYTAD